MMSLVYVFWMYVIIFAVIGWLRGWAKELLVSFSVILALTFIHVVYRYLPVGGLLNTPTLDFWFRTIVLAIVVFFGYQTVISVPRLASKALRERFQDSLFGIVLGALNGYLIAGSVLYFLHQANYPFPQVVSPPAANSALAETLVRMMDYMPPALLGEPGIYFAVILSFVFVLVVYI
ncbi:MAG: CvpA family protein [Anaerolineales bacterium]